MLSRFFIDRPIFAWVIAIFIALAGVLADRPVAGRAVSEHRTAARSIIQTTYPGASAETVENTVTQVIEQQLTGIDGLLYFSSTTGSTGQAQHQRHVPRRHRPRHRAGAGAEQGAAGHARGCRRKCSSRASSCSKSQFSFQLIVGISDTIGQLRQHRHLRLSRQPLHDPICARPRRRRRAGVRLALRDADLARSRTSSQSYNLTPTDVRDAVRAQNTQVSAGEIGAQPAAAGAAAQRHGHRADRAAARREQFRNIILQARPAAPRAARRRRARRARRRELPRHQPPERPPGLGHGGALAPGANALTTADAVKARRPSSQPRCRRAGAVVPRRQHALHPHLDRGGRQDADRGDRAGRPRDVHLPAELARDADSRRSRCRSCCSARSACSRCSAYSINTLTMFGWCCRSACSSTTRSSWSRTSSG